jgi:uncharacterized membrane protein YdjX (TVP38/TMEM64 family)
MTLKRTIPLLLLGLGLALFMAFDLGRFFDLAELRAHQTELQRWVDERPVAGPAAFVLLYTTLVAFSLPVASFATIVGGFLFGAWFGTLWTAMGATLGASLVFLAARTALREMLRAKAGPWLDKLEGEFRTNGFHYLLFLRLVPAFPFWLVNIAPALFGLRFAPFVSATAVGILPGTFVFAYFGHGLSATLQQNPDRLDTAGPGVFAAGMVQAAPGSAQPDIPAVQRVSSHG